MSILQTENLTKIYGDGENAVHALRGINLLYFRYVPLMSNRL